MIHNPHAVFPCCMKDTDDDDRLMTDAFFVKAQYSIIVG